MCGLAGIPRWLAPAVAVLIAVCIPQDARGSFCQINTELLIVPADPHLRDALAGYDVVIEYAYQYHNESPSLQGIAMAAGPKGWRSDPWAFKLFGARIALTDTAR